MRSCWDNAVAYSFFGSLKERRIKKRVFATREATFMDRSAYVDGLYKVTRRQSYLGGVAPDDPKPPIGAAETVLPGCELHPPTQIPETQIGSSMSRREIGQLIADRLYEELPMLRRQYTSSVSKIGHFVIDDLLPVEIASKIYSCFPPAKNMRLKKSLREHKYVAAQMDMYDPLLEETVYAFQDARVVKAVVDICGIKQLYPDEHLYAGGISLMEDKNFLNPHLDNSHDKDRVKWRVFNLLYYVTPDWMLSDGGNLELWPNGLDHEQVTIHSKFNRLAVMATHETSWHSVSPIRNQTVNRCCVSNYYFSESPLKNGDAFHVTSFRGRPEQRARDIVLRADIAARMALRTIFKKGVVENKHIYKRDVAKSNT
jgi:Rps23 Pro-64 3,4-dihydroxylase Tpa1-like proline 4-hydroxylase